MTKPDSAITFPCGAIMKNRFMLAPMTNKQSHEDGCLSEDEFHWLTMRAKGQFGMVMTCASHVQAIGKGFGGQLGIFSDIHLKGHQRLSKAIQAHGSLAVVQLHHAGMRSPESLINEAPVAPSKVDKYGARALTHQEVIQLREDFIKAAIRAQKSGYDGIEVHGAHGYILTQFLSSLTNQRQDEYGGSLENRARIILEIINGIRTSCGPNFLLGLRLSPENYGMKIDEIKWLCQKIDAQRQVDFVDISLWDSFKQAEEEQYQNQGLLDIFTHLPLKNTLLTVAGKIRSAVDVHKVLGSGVDFVAIGRSGILHHDFPQQVIDNPQFVPVTTPVEENYLLDQGLGHKFIAYMRRWEGFVQGD